MAEFKISRFRYTWKGNWSTSTLYLRDDVVRYGGSSYVCIREHTADSNFYTDLYFIPPGETAPSPAWVKMTDGSAWRGDWTTLTQYNLGDVVLYGGVLYTCTTAYTSSVTFDDQIGNWAIYSSQINPRGAWTVSTRYGIGDIVQYGGNVYRCTAGHTSAATNAAGLELDSDKWSAYFEGTTFKGTYAAATKYKVNDLAVYNGSLLKCTVGHTSSSTFNEANWENEFPGSEFEDAWTSTVYYGLGSIVRHGGYLYYGLKPNYNKIPTNSIYQIENGGPFWALLSKTTNLRGDWQAATNYKTGDVVRRGGNLYICTIDYQNDDSTLDYLDESNWKILTPGQAFHGAWRLGQNYGINDVVTYRGLTYKCSVAHASTRQNYPGDNGSGFNYWDILVDTGLQMGTQNPGDLLTFDLSRSLAGDGSTLGPVGIPIRGNLVYDGDGNNDDTNVGKFLTVNSEGSAEYLSAGVLSRTYYVSPFGIDSRENELQGLTDFLPWKTIRYACEQADDDFEGYTTIKVTVGKYEEVLPIIVPARTVILGSELRSTVVVPNTPIESLALDRTYTIAALNRISSIMEDLITNQTVTKTVSNTQSQSTSTPASNLDTAIVIQSFIQQINNYINYYLADIGSLPVVSGTNTANISAVASNAIAILEANKEFLAEEAASFISTTYPGYSFNSELCKRDIRSYVEAWKYDLRYTGNYKSLLAARYYVNAVTGSQTEDMFYMRDATGLRNLTLEGLAGELTPPNVNDLYRVPTGGSFVSLDPGWGPEDNRAWITTRSPYIQGVTTIGTGCTGQKIDGALHNGGNRSMVSNDFTQVLSDGVGAWVLNQGRAELVSVFTYYCHVGYLSQNGGIIRGTNGNCSYGRFGAVADGIDDTETPQSGSVQNRLNDAVIASAFSGTFNDEILLLEWANAGQNYTNATASIIGSGVNASVLFEEFRDNAIFESRLLDTSTSIAQSIGGGGYTVVQNSAQVHLTLNGDLTSITIATNDPNTEADYLGMRILIIGGTGTGQYGYITGYDTESKVVTVSRESDNQPGWDHVIPGTPIANPLDTTTLYRIEPRVIFSAPEFVSTSVDLPVVTNWGAVTYGETTETYTNLSGGEPEGAVVDQDGLTLITARWTVVKNGRNYTVTNTNPGAGYLAGQILTIPGNSVGGATPTNDITIRVDTISDDSTDSIVTFTATGVGASGRFVATTLAGSAAVWSNDGEEWTAFNMPSVGDWANLAAGNNRFVAIRKNSNIAASSLDGKTWLTRTMPASRNWADVTFGDGKFVAVASNNNSAAYSTNGTSWTAATMPTFGDSTINEWTAVTYGKQKFVAVANTGNVAAYSSDGITWTGTVMDAIEDSSQKDWVSVAYGNNRFVAISSQGDIAYSFDGMTWSGATLPTQDGSTMMNWVKVKYANGIFFAICDTGGKVIAGDTTTGPTRFAATSEDGINWTGRTLSTLGSWKSIAFGNPYIEVEDSTIGRATPMWVAVSENSGTVAKTMAGKRAQGRVVISGGIVEQVKLWDPGSSYIDGPTLTLVDPNNTSDAVVDNRLGDGVLCNPTWLNRGFGYRAATTRVTITTGDGFADIIPFGKLVKIGDLARIPGPGAQILFNGNEQRYVLSAIIDSTEETDGTFTVTLRVSPEIKVRDNLFHNTPVEIREQYSQIRITGHDFLDIGTGNFEETNYPELYSGFYDTSPEQEVIQEDGGRVFYTSTDQSGNFRAGELFAVEQATGIVTISADFFDLSGLTELRLGGIRIGGSAVVVREFSTDPLFTENSNNIVPTQRAIKAFLQNRLSVGGAELTTASFIAGLVKVGPDSISNVLGTKVVIPVRADFEGPTVGISGSLLALKMYTKSMSDDPRIT